MAMNAFVMGKDQLKGLLNEVKELGYNVVAPVLEDGIIRLCSVESGDQLATNVVTVQSPGRYAVKESELVFSFTHGPDSPKRFLYPPLRKTWKMEKDGGHFELKEAACGGDKIALFGIKPCDLASIEVLDRTLLRGKYADPQYTSMRSNTALIVANCIEPSGTCFCASMGTGPRAKAGFDLALTELPGGFLVELGTELGEQMIAHLQKRAAKPEDLKDADRLTEAARSKMGRELDTNNLRDRLYARLESPEFKEIAERCLGCANCTNVCPTCFCTMVQDIPSLDGRTSERQVTWDSCFTYQFAQVAGGHFRPELWARYRQWMNHKFAYWLDQFDTFGCIGCGRCITWCPVGIDVTESVKDVQEVKQ